MELEIAATLLIGLVGGVVWRSFIDLGSAFIFFLTLLSLALAAFSARCRLCALAAIFLLAAGLGIFRYDMVDTKESLSYLTNFEGQSVKVVATIIEEPAAKDKSTTLVVSASLARSAGVRPFKVLILTRPLAYYKYGDHVEIYGRLERIKNFSADFDYASYMGKDEIYYQFVFPKIVFKSPADGFDLQGKLFDFKNSFLDKINSAISEPESSLMGGLILGAKSSMNKDLIEIFKEVGLIHIVAVSGYNVTVVADGLMKSIWFLPLIARLCIGSIAVILFALMVGSGSTVIRASIMALLAMLARATGRMYLAGAALFVAAALMILDKPKILVFDISFQLSFLATAGLIFFTPILEKYLKFLPERFGFRGATISTLSAQIAVWPLILYRMGNFSVVSVPANLLVGPVVPASMFLGFLTGFAGFFSRYLSLFFGYISYPFVFYIVKIAEIFSMLPFASITATAFPLSLTLIIYIAYLVIILSRNIRGDTI